MWSVKGGNWGSKYLKEKLKVKTEQVNEMFDKLNSLKAETGAYAKQL